MIVNKAIGMYSVYKSAKNNLCKTLISLKEMGYDGIEFWGEPNDFPKDTVNRAIAKSGITLTGWHIEWKHLQSETIEDTIAYCKDISLKNIIIPCLGSKWNIGHTQAEECEEVWHKYIAQIESIRQRLQKENINLGYHNHEHEFKLIYNGKTVFETLYDSFNNGIIMELDTGNAIEGGFDPTYIVNKYDLFKKHLHLKPWGPKYGFNVMLGSEYDLNDYRAIIKAAYGSAEWFIIESEANFTDELKNAKVCLDALNSIILAL